MKLKEWVVIYVAAFLFTVGDWIKEDNECW